MNRNSIPKALQPSMRLYFIVLVVFAVLGVVFRSHWVLLVLCEAAILILLLVYTLISDRRRKARLVSYIENITGSADTVARDNVVNFPVPTVIYNLATDRILWSNDRFGEITGERDHLFEINMTDVAPTYSGSWLSEGHRECPGLTELGGRKYKIYGSIIRSDRSHSQREFLAVTYWVDVTDYAETYDEYSNSRPVGAIILLDNYDELLKGLAEKDKSALLSNIDGCISDWAGSCGGLLTKSDRDRYLFLFEERYLQNFIDSKFSLLEQVRKFTGAGGIRATVSIGLGKGGESFEECFRFASLSVEMALSRGGDQVVMKDRLNFEFFGGQSAEQDKSSSVKYRVLSNAFSELIGDASMVLVMGHKMADLDTIGAAVGVCSAARKLGVPYRIVYHPERNASVQLIEKLKALPEYAEAFISSQQAILKADSKTFLVVVDTNRPAQVESESLLISCNRVAVIDHHRRAADYIENPDISIHEPSASSASELVAELLQFILEPSDILPIEAEAVLSGIVLDTKNFTMRTGSRTFDTAAFLQRSGADPASVKRLLQSDMASARQRFGIISKAKDYGNGIALAKASSSADRIVIAKAADELLNITGINASFVLAPSGDGVTISGRSLGDVDVQQILEHLGGGGNRTTAGVQMADITMDNAYQQLTNAIDAYISYNTAAEPAN
ncbi:MAG: DHH family phosphoesterase [Oscillospiraceae bacterium]|nr:DHH family phosphoesterase [Oscillospiraceae bacterium]